MPAQTYVETMQGTPFDWYAFLQKKKHTEKEWAMASSLAGDWVTCACGNQCAIIPRSPDFTDDRMTGEPMDEVLSQLGYEFAIHIDDWALLSARLTLEKIERRSAELIAEIQAKGGK